ncbi:hypothetical protein B0H12DRAFT_1108184 [Mycena haematopus]|nr:hypothetical protein B0H12DRAFT_1108184 [Mycena haematopus]
MAASGTVRTATHSYPQREVNAMTSYYDGRCAVTQQQASIQRAHQMDAALPSSTIRLKWMADRKLRQIRNERHAGELRENVLTLAPTIHLARDQGVPTCTIFPHEDVLARVLDFEREVQDKRLDMIRRGEGDPGRPPYDVGYPTISESQETGKGSPDRWGPVLPHRFYSVISDSILIQGRGVYESDACPGDPGSPHRFPVFNTLLSIPFSVLHNAPRLGAMFPMSSFQAQVLRRAYEIVELWSWDPIPSDFPNNMVTAATIPVQWPPAVHDVSRQPTTFSSFAPSYYSRIVQSAPGPTSLPSGQLLISGGIDVVYNQDGGLVPVAPKFLQDDEDNKQGLKDEYLERCAPSSFSATYNSSSTSTKSESESEGNSDSHADRNMQHLAVSDIRAWMISVLGPYGDPLPLKPTPFESGTLGGLCSNDTLMITGSLDPAIYVRYKNLAVFSV